MSKKFYKTPELRLREAEWEENFLLSLDGPGGSDMPIDETDPDLWG